MAASGEQQKIQSVGVGFVKRFFETLNGSPEQLYRFFLSQALFSFNELSASGREQIKEALEQLDLANVRVGGLEKVVTQPVDTFVLVYTNGLWGNRSAPGPRRRFFAAFCLAKRDEYFDIRTASFIVLQEDSNQQLVTPVTTTITSPTHQADSPSPVPAPSSSPVPPPTSAPSPLPAEPEESVASPAPAPPPAAAVDAQRASASSPPATNNSKPEERTPSAPPTTAPVEVKPPSKPRTYAEASSKPASPAAALPSAGAPPKGKAPAKRPPASASASASASTNNTHRGHSAASSSEHGAPESSAASPTARGGHAKPKHGDLKVVLRGVPEDCPKTEISAQLADLGLTVKTIGHDPEKSRLVFVRFAGVADPQAALSRVTSRTLQIRGAPVTIEPNHGSRKPRSSGVPRASEAAAPRRAGSNFK